MQAKIKELQQALDGFLQQSRYSVLVIGLEESELIFVLKMIQTMDQGDNANVYGLFPQAVAKPSPDYVGEIITSLASQLDGANTARTGDGQPAWPPMPEICSDPRAPATQRLRAAILHARSLVPNDPDNRLVFAILPQQIDLPAAYLDALSSLLPAPSGPPDPAWAGIRLILRDDGRKPALIPQVRQQKNPHVLVYEPDLSPAALMDSMAQEVADPTLTEAERMEVLGQLASLDFAYGRLDEAAAKYGVLYDYYRRYKAPAMQALVLQGVGDILRKTSNLPLARERYAQGLTLALETQSLPLMLGLTYNVGDVNLELGNFSEAEGHLDIARTIASKTLNPQLQADAMEKMGIARLGEKRYADAVAIWNEAAEVCRGCNHRDRLCSILERMAAVYGAGRKLAEQHACEVELGAVRAGAPLVRKTPLPKPSAAKETS
jgi:tetratricopeptide (TPR) repeat protein